MICSIALVLFVAGILIICHTPHPVPHQYRKYDTPTPSTLADKLVKILLTLAAILATYAAVLWLIQHAI